MKVTRQKGERRHSQSQSLMPHKLRSESLGMKLDDRESEFYFQKLSFSIWRTQPHALQYACDLCPWLLAICVWNI